ncbi:MULTISPECIES: DUF5362 family protein [unclassified Gilliamella]|uniref:DUF5362 family protein n=1 Tax=unclassified Gilliamella TaxID=2685620 RepID=UPI00080E5A85|nr:DUF5362 family protein [Gilliamella apicola]OCG21747.1 hypothetical protein A9G23_03980 [Gilliamella apicola]OCG22077.1 hypothetical protein A9G22_08380 [Gilliamella apicola]
MNNNETNTISLQVSDLLQKCLRFIGVMQQIFGVLVIISGAIACLGIISAIVGVPVIIGGIKLFQSGSSFILTAKLKHNDDLVNAINGLHGYWMFMLITFILSVAMFITMLFLFTALVSSAIYGY